jgi:hypothetical protein
MKYSDELDIDGRSYRIAGAAAGGGCELTVRADDVGAGPVEVRVTAPAGELALVGEIVQRSLSGLAHLAGGGTGGGQASQHFKLRQAEDRRQYPRAWSAWTPDDDSRLLDGHRSGMDVGQLATELGRKPRAILSRLVKHGVVAQQ